MRHSPSEPVLHQRSHSTSRSSSLTRSRPDLTTPIHVPKMKSSPMNPTPPSSYFGINNRDFIPSLPDKSSNLDPDDFLPVFRSSLIANQFVDSDVCLILSAQIWFDADEARWSVCNARNHPRVVHAGTNGTGSCIQRGPRAPTYVNCSEQSTPQPSGGSQLVATQRCQGNDTDHSSSSEILKIRGNDENCLNSRLQWKLLSV